MDKRFLDVEGQSLHCREVGPAASVGRAGSRPVLIFPPAPRSGQHSEPLLASFPRDAHAVAVDLPGLGESWRPPVPLTLLEQVRVAVALIESLAWIAYDVVGEGVGGSVAIELALRHPARVERLALIDPPLLPQPIANSAAGPWPPLPRADGSHWLEIWNRPTLAGLTAEERQDVLIDLYRGGADAARVAALLGTYPFAANLARVRQPVEVFESMGARIEYGALHEFLHRTGDAGRG